MTLSNKAFNELIHSLEHDNWKVGRFEISNTEKNISIWIANGFSHYQISNSPITFTILQKYKIGKAINKAADNYIVSKLNLPTRE